MPYGRVKSGDVLYLLENDGSGLIQARAEVTKVLNSDKMEKEVSIALVDEHQDQLQLSVSQYKRWAGKRYLVLIEIEELEVLTPFAFDRSDYGNMDDWLPVNDIQTVKLK